MALNVNPVQICQGRAPRQASRSPCPQSLSGAAFNLLVLVHKGELAGGATLSPAMDDALLCEKRIFNAIQFHLLK